MMETDNQGEFVIRSDGITPDDEALEESSKHPTSKPVGERADDGEDIEDIGSEDEDEDEEEEEEEGEISLDEEDIDDEELEGDDDEEMQDADAADEDVTMQSVEHNGPSNHPVAQAS
jgi:hypothetical protein